jgi:hypothetical protein
MRQRHAALQLSLCLRQESAGCQTAWQKDRGCARAVSKRSRAACTGSRVRGMRGGRPVRTSSLYPKPMQPRPQLA